MTKHALMSPSSAHRWLICPGSLLLNRDKPRTSSAAADQGTCAHEIAAHCLETGNNCDDYINCESQDAPGQIFTVDMVDPTQEYVDYVRDLVKNLKETGEYESVDMYVEVSVDISEITGEEGACGTSDALVIAKRKSGGHVFHVIDLKFGRGVEVSAIDNPQTRLYGFGAIESFSALIDGPIDALVCHIHQPRKQNISIESLDSAEAEAWMEQVEDRCEDIQGMFRQAEHLLENDEDLCNFLFPSEKGCQFCDSKVECPALRAKAVYDAKLEFASEEVIPTVVPSDVQIMSKVVLNRKLIESYLDAVEAEAKKQLELGKEIPGLKLVHKASRAKWQSEEAAIKAMKKAGLKKPEYTKTSAISITDAKKAVGKAKFSILEEAIIKPKGAIVAASSSDKREEAIGVVIEPVGDSDKPSLTIS